MLVGQPAEVDYSLPVVTDFDHRLKSNCPSSYNTWKSFFLGGGQPFFLPSELVGAATPLNPEKAELVL